MDKEITNKALVDIIKCYLNDTIYTLANGLNIDDLLSLANSQKLVALVYLVLKRSQVTLTSEQSDLFKQYYISSIKHANMQTRAINSLKKIFAEKGIDFCFFKGADLRTLFAPNEEIRTMSDIDVLVSAEDKKVILPLLSKNSDYKTIHYNGVDITTINDINFELHGVVNYFDTDIVTTNDIVDHHLPYDKYLYLLVTHIASHIATSGCGIRQLIDIAKFYQNYDGLIDYDAYNRYMKSINLDKFAKIVTMLVNELFGVKSSHDYSDLDEATISYEFILTMRNFLLSNGVFGHDDIGAVAEMRSAKLAIQSKKTPSRIRTLQNLVVPPLASLAKTFPNLNKHKWLYPYYSLVRIYRAIFVKKIKGSMIIKSTGNIERINEKKALLEALNIK